MYLINFYVPESHLEPVKNALFDAGAGKLGDYQQCCWQTLGQGQFMPLAGSSPYIGEQNKLEFIDEYKVEMVFEDKYLDAVIQALKDSHPYEKPAYQIIKCVN